MAISKEDQTSRSFDHCHYVPCLRWSQGEYQALFRSREVVKSQFTPLIEIAEIGFDFETWKEAETIDEHLTRIGKRVAEKWGDRRFFIDLKRVKASEKMANGTHPVDFVFQDLKTNKCSGIPVTGIDRDREYQAAVKRIAQRDDLGICLRVTLEQMAKPTIATEIDRILSFFEPPKEAIDLILDLGAPNFSPLAGFQKLVVAIVQQIPFLDQWRTFTLVGTSFPLSMAQVSGIDEVFPRSEWILYKNITNNLKELEIRLPTFGDYAVNHPDVIVADMRIIKPAATIRYTIDDGWWILKGLNVRDNGFGQYRAMCARLVQSPRYSGYSFSAGDRYIRDCARGNAKTGNLTTWRWVGTNHHLQKILSDLSNFYGAANKI